MWLNNPLFPLEACGTSGQKAAANGVPSLSILDGWWEEGYNRDNGWAPPDASELPPEQHDEADAKAGPVNLSMSTSIRSTPRLSASDRMNRSGDMR